MEKKTILEYFGGVSKTAIALNISHPAVSRWGDHPRKAGSQS